MKKCLLTLSLITILSLVAHAQNFVATINSSVNSSTSGTLTLAAFSTDTEIEAGLVTTPLTFAVKSNRLWKLMTSISTITFTTVAGGPTIEAPLLPGNIQWGVANGTTPITSFTAFGGLLNPVQAKTGPRGAPDVTGNTFNLQYKVVPTFTVDPGVYTVTVVNTISGQ